MSKVLEKKLKDELTFVLDYQIDAEEYQDFKGRILEQVAKGIEVKGFRKGKAPVDIALKEADPQEVSSKLLKEIIEKYSPEAIKSAEEELEKKNRAVMQYNVDYSAEKTKENEDGSFQFSLVASLLPDIDLKLLDKVKIKEPTKKDIVDLPPFEQFKKEERSKILLENNVYKDVKESVKDGYQVVIDMLGKIDNKKIDSLNAKDFSLLLDSGLFLPDFEKELKGLKAGDKKEFKLTFPENYGAKEVAGKTADMKIEVKEVKKPKYKKVVDLLKNSEKLQEYYKTEKDLNNDIERVYDQKVENILNNARRKAVISETLKAIPNFPLQNNLLESEVNRIFMLLKEDSEKKEITIGQAFAQSKLPEADVKGVEKYDEEKIKELLKDYVSSELKLTQILAFIYETQIENKPKQEELNDYVKAVSKNKKGYNIPEDAGEEQVRSIVTDRIVRQMAGDWLINKIRNNSIEEKKEKDSSKKKGTPKKTKK